MRLVDAGWFANSSAGLMGRFVNSPPQLGQMPASFCATQVVQNVHSKEQIIASLDSGGRSLLQHSQFGLSASMCHTLHVRYKTSYNK